MILTVTLLLYMHALCPSYGQVISGCPLYGCTPGGSFSLDSVLSSPKVQIAWIAKLENSSTTTDVKLGCVSNVDNLVCPTSTGYVSLDPKTGKERWRKDILHRPTLPIMDIYGDVIGCDGRSLVMIESDGTAQPSISLDLPIDSIYSLNLLDNSAFLILSTNGMVIAYLINGVPLGSLELTGNMAGENGTFHPIAPPVISGHRIYILTEFKPSNNGKYSTEFRTRLIAIDVKEDIADRLHIVWFVDFHEQSGLQQTKPAASNPLSSHALMFSPHHRNTAAKLHRKQNITLKKRYQSLVDNNRNTVKTTRLFISKMLSNYHLYKPFNNNRTWAPSVLVQGDIVYVSLSFSGITGDHSSNVSKLIAVKDLHDASKIIFEDNKPISHLASVPYNFMLKKEQVVANNNVIWSVGKSNGSIINGVDFLTGKTIANINLTQIVFGTTVEVTTKLMVTYSKGNILFTIGLEHKKSSKYYLVAIGYNPMTERVNVIYKINSPGNTQIVGQIISATTTDNQIYILATTIDGSIFAIDVVRRMVGIVSVIWKYTFPIQACQSREHWEQDNIGAPNASLLVTGSTILVSLPASSSIVACSSSDTKDMLWSIEDKGTSATLMYRMALPVSKLSMYVQNQDNMKTSVAFSISDLLWATPIANSGEIVGIDVTNGLIVYKLNLMSYFGKNVSITTDVMASSTNNSAILTLGLKNGTNPVLNWLTSLEIKMPGTVATPIWKLRIPSTEDIAGQIITFNSAKQNNDVKLAVFSTINHYPSIISLK